MSTAAPRGGNPPPDDRDFEIRALLERVAEVEDGYRHLEKRIRELRDALVPIADMDLESGITPQQLEELRQHIERARDAVITF